MLSTRRPQPSPVRGRLDHHAREQVKHESSPGVHRQANRWPRTGWGRRCLFPEEPPWLCPAVEDRRLALKGRGMVNGSSDPELAAKGRAGVGIYRVPPERAIVLPGDEQPQVQALNSREPRAGRAHRLRAQAGSDS